MLQIAKIAIQAATYAIDKPYDYLVPDTLTVSVGVRVVVPFGRGNRRSEGMILALEQGTPNRQLKAVETVLDETPPLSLRQIRMALWMCKRYFCTFYEALHAILPIGLWVQLREVWAVQPDTGPMLLSSGEQTLFDILRQEPQELAALQGIHPQARSILGKLEKQGLVCRRAEAKRHVADKTALWVALAVSAEDAEAIAREKRSRSPKMSDALLFLLQNGETGLHDLMYYTGVSRQALTRLEKTGILVFREQEVFRVELRKAAQSAEDIRLNEEQQAAYDEILAQIRCGKAGVTLLQGVTGSGKTLIYIRLAQQLLAEGKTAMILVPEIALTPQMMQHFSAYFGEDVALLHSGLRITERYDQYKRIRQGLVKIVLGTRSAVFAPLEHLGMIVMDEEQEDSYESENVPGYHARDIAKYRCAKEGARLILGSATPTVETAYHAYRGDYQLCRLQKRFNAHALPQVDVVDMRQELREGNYTSISRTLYEQMRKNLNNGEQTILFLNRRGNSRQIICSGCGYVPQCPNCSVFLTYHSANRRLMCHHCGYSERYEENCPQCGSAYKNVGLGTQKVEQELRELFPNTEILRMDTDSVGVQHEKLLHKFETEKIPILLGTQMVAKGLDFENVTLVGVLAADMSLYADHYRAVERTFSLLTQVVGRAGRGDRPGRAILQTYTPENEVLCAAANQDYQHFYEREILLREARRDPPFAQQLILTVTGPEESLVRRACAEVKEGLCTALCQAAFQAAEAVVLGPAPAGIVKVNNRFRYCLTVAGQLDVSVRELTAAILREFSKRKENKTLHIYADFKG